MEDLKARIKQEALALGFSLAGVTSPEPPAGYPRYEAWLEAGHHGGMSYLASELGRERRADPRKILPGCRSIIVLATAYRPENLPSQDAQAGPRIAAYALGRDYHLTLVERMHALVACIQGMTAAPFSSKVYTDTGPILERELARRAGLGWIGRNSCLIHPQQGSFLFLSEILVSLELEPDPPFEKDLCGTCRRCIDACPTGCILENHTIDANRCISYLTIEAHGRIQEELREPIGNRLFGCDTCQDVCPWNRRFGSSTRDFAFMPRPHLADPSLPAFLRLNPEAWREPFAESPLPRAKRKGLVRNACVVAGNTRDPASIPALETALRCDPEALVREHAAWALGQIGGTDVLAVLGNAMLTETNPAVRSAIQKALISLP
ncbi:MAG: tRNA epoxyqueuosine(34) reductase QueG [Anaerolineales bacterium]|nr:tRNA epoxyqueuosine(34) reductase QueG [Anaerolineales bacterium]